MADMLKFRKGTYAQINAAPKAAGTIYIAKDEKAMYVDVDASTRIRIGDFIRVASIEEIPKPYSETAVYYVEGANALLGYKDGQWKQINGTEELVTRIAAVENQVAVNKADIATNKANIATNTSDINTLKGTVGTHSTDIEALKAAVGMDDEGNVEGLAGSVAAIREDLTELETEVHGTNGNGGMVATLADHAGRINTLENAGYATVTQVNTAKEEVLGEAGYVGTVKGAYEAAAAAQTQANKGVADAATAQTKANANEEAISALAGRVTALDQTGTGKVAILEGKVDTLEKAGYATIGQVNTAKGEVLGTEADAAGTATVHGALKSAAAADAKAVAAANAASAAQGDIDAWETAHANDYTNTKIDELVADAKKAGTDAQNDFNAYETAHASDYTNTQIDAKVKAVQDKVDEHSASLNTLTGTGTGSVAEAKAAAAAAQKTADDYIEAHKNDYANTKIDELVADAKAAGTGAASTANANASAIAQLQADLKAVTDDYVTEGELDGVKKALQAEIDKDIRAANAMEYVDTIESESALPATAKNGATYVVGSAFGNYAAGDMLIAQGDEDPDTGLITNPTWAHVKSGYDASLDQELTGEDNKIKLSTGTGLAGTEVAFTATGSASVSVADNTVTIGMVWEDFE